MRIRIFYKLLVILLLTPLSGCTSLLENKKNDSNAFTSSVVFYGTDRARYDSSHPAEFYGSARGNIEFGEASIAVPEDGDSAILQKVVPFSKPDFINKLRLTVKSSDSRAVFVFVHGYNRSFEKVAASTADFYQNIKFSGIPIFWSWPSTNNPAGYVEDRNNVRWGRPHLAAFIRDVIENSGAETVHILGHSMGGFAVAEAFLNDLIPNGLDTTRIGEFVLLAPDIDAEIFRRDIGPKLVNADLDITLYASSNDKAMASSRAINGYPRAGDSFDGATIVPGIETIDATAANSSILGHSYFEESEAVGADLAVLLNDRLNAADRELLTAYKLPNGIYWRLSQE